MTGWPWTTAPRSSNPHPTALPRISVVTPSYNQAEYLEATIRSVLLQDYPDFEYIVIDGGSTDSSVAILEKYSEHLTYWVSEKDAGQADAINKGLALTSGNLLAYINSDDYYLPGAFSRAGSIYAEHSDTDLIHGRCMYVDQYANPIGSRFSTIDSLTDLLDLWGVWWGDGLLVQPEVFWSRRIAERAGQFNDQLQFSMDYEYWIRLFKLGCVVRRFDEPAACLRRTPGQKSRDSRCVDELLAVVKSQLWDYSLDVPWLKRLTLQGNWLHQSILCQQLRSYQTQPGRLRSIRDVLLTLLAHPKILLSNEFYDSIITRLRK